jgi:hypothetical protein
VREVAFFQQALDKSGFVTHQAPSPLQAPFIWDVEAPWGERLTLIVYAFFANKYKQKGRPADEHRFQVKYGGDLSGYHEIYVPASSDEVTLFLGAHLDAGIFVGADPLLHNPTRFSSSVEFKDEYVENTKAVGWTSWERDRSATRRKTVMPEESLSTEVLVGFLPERLGEFVFLERIAAGYDPGERMLLSDKIKEGRLRPAKLTPEQEYEVLEMTHPLELELDLGARLLLDLIQDSFRLKVALRGAVAEYHLLQILRGDADVDHVKRLDKDGLPDFRVIFLGREILVECKNVLRGKKTRDGHARVDFQRTRAAKGNACSRYYQPSEFQVLAACLHPVTESWEYRFRATANLVAHPKCPGRLSPRVVVDEAAWGKSITEVLESLPLR